jgi:metallo-beta-lactamase family protein
MCEGGRIVHHLANNIEDPRNTVLFVGYQAEHTLGRRLVEKVPEISIFGEVVQLNAEVVVLNSFSAHADQVELMEYISQADQKRLKKIFLVHGEITQIEKLLLKLKDKNNNADIHIPILKEKYEI